MMFHSASAKGNDTEPKKIKICELSIYDNPQDKYEVHVLEEEITPYKSGVTTVRKSLFTFLDSFNDTTDTIKDKYEIGKAHTQSTIEYIRNDPGILPRAGVITVAGLGGIIAGYKGKAFKKVFLSVSAMVGAASLCYPNQAVEIATDVYNKAYDQVKSVTDQTGKKK